MDTIVGRGGNQAINLSESGAASAHCVISRTESGYNVYPINVAPTFVDGSRIFEMDDEFDGKSKISVGNFTGTIEDLYRQADFSGITDWGTMSERMPDADAARMFNNITVKEYIEDNDNKEALFLWDNAAACQAYYLIEAGKLRKAQELLYEAGDELYEAQDGSVRLKTAYASLLVLLAWLYVKAGRKDVAIVAKNGAQQLIGAGAQCSARVSNLLKTLD
ncbi:MAG: FHA domain-containing protein [Bacteroidales bacterium]|nr:FHA domain-containing protein [Bacteroidales bacterium]